MADVITINKETLIIDGNVVVNETTKTTMTKRDLERKLDQVKTKKQRVREQNNRMIEEFNTLTIEESEVEDLIARLPEETTDIEIL